MTLLRGKILISTVSSHKTEELRSLFQPLGASLIDFPLTEIVPAPLGEDIQLALRNIDQYQWVIFTSGNGVIHFFKRFQELKIDPVKMDYIKFAVVGLKTAQELEKKGKKPDFVGSGNTAEDLLEEFLKKESPKQSRILLSLGNLAPETLENRLSLFNVVERINVYHTVKAHSSNKEIIDKIIANDYDLILFTSPSGVDHFYEIMNTFMPVDAVKAASIGKVTSLSLSNKGINCLVTAKRSTYEGLCEEIVSYYHLNN